MCARCCCFSIVVVLVRQAVWMQPCVALRAVIAMGRLGMRRWSCVHLTAVGLKSIPHLPRCLRVLHVPSMTVFSNWPTSKSPLHYVHSTAYSPNSGYLAIGNARGRVLLYRLHHYNKA